MRNLSIIALVSVVIGQACYSGSKSNWRGGDPLEHDPWRRTAAGWELVADWPGGRLGQVDPPSFLAGLHPALVGTLQLLVSLAALAWFEPETVGSPSPRHCRIAARGVREK